MTSEIVLRNISKQFGDKVLFMGFSLEIEQGEFLSIMGASGAGKTTLLNIIGMLDVPDSGAVIIRGHENPKFSSRTSNLLRRYDISYLFQNYGLIDAETVEENIRIATRFKKFSKQEERAAIAASLEKLGLQGFESKKVYTLSGGEQQRVALAKILIKSPGIILADEPTGSLDADNRDYIMRMLQELNEEGKTIVVVSHDPKVTACAKKHLRI
ncbi:MAG: putative bacteriocin export ABC transporter [Chloroflexota bacterium]|nr:putative bacteriocin export ABC transporter [Chloroflexota bacterium]